MISMRLGKSSVEVTKLRLEAAVFNIAEMNIYVHGISGINKKHHPNLLSISA